MGRSGKSAAALRLKSTPSPAPLLNPLQEMKKEVMAAYLVQSAEKEEAAKRDRRHQELQAVVESLQEQLNAERQEKLHLRQMTSSLRQRMEAVKAACGTLDRQRLSFEQFTKSSKAARELRSPEMLAPNGLLNFANMKEGGGGRIEPQQTVDASGTESSAPHRNAIPGRSSKRTAYCTDYGNVKYLGTREQDAKEELQRRIQVILKEKDAAAAAAAAIKDTSCAVDAKGPEGASPHMDEYRGLSSYGYFGADSRINLQAFHKRSSRRTRMYRDYEGKFIGMDACDWPTTEGANL